MWLAPARPCLACFVGRSCTLLACKLSQAGDMLCILLCMVCSFWLERATGLCTPGPGVSCRMEVKSYRREVLLRDVRQVPGLPLALASVAHTRRCVSTGACVFGPAVRPEVHRTHSGCLGAETMLSGNPGLAQLVHTFGRRATPEPCAHGPCSCRSCFPAA